MASTKPTNLEETAELRNEGGSDVFTSTRHVNSNVSECKIKSKSSFLLHIFFSFHDKKVESTSDFKLKFWSNDDAPLIRPLLKTEPYIAPNKVQTSIGINHHQMDGYGGIACERITKISGRSSMQWMAGYAALIVSGGALFALLVKFKQPKKSSS